MSDTDSIHLPIGRGVTIPTGLTEDDFELLIATLKLWKDRIVARRIGAFKCPACNDHFPDRTQVKCPVCRITLVPTSETP